MKSVTDREIGQLIQERRIALGLSQGQLTDQLRADGLAWSQGTVSKVENGERPVRLSEAGAIANALDIKPYQLLDRSDPLRDYMIRLSFQVSELGGEIQDLEQRVFMARVTQQALGLLYRAHGGEGVPTEHDVETLTQFAFMAVELPRTIAILKQIGVSPDRIADELPAVNASNSGMFPEADALKRLAPDVAKALPTIRFNVATETEEDG